MTYEQIVLASTMLIMIKVIHADPEAFDSLHYQYGPFFLKALLTGAIAIAYVVGLVYIVIQSVARNAL